jgi:L-fucose isomerase-like protein
MQCAGSISGEFRAGNIGNLVSTNFGGPVMYVGAAEEEVSGLMQCRGDAYCGMLNCSYNLGLRGLKAIIRNILSGHFPRLPKGLQTFCQLREQY